METGDKHENFKKKQLIKYENTAVARKINILEGII